MKSVNSSYEAINSSLNQEPRYTIELAYDFASTDLVYFTSHSDAQFPSGGTVISNVIADNGLSGTSQKLNPLAGNASIGAITVKLIDYDEAITAQINTKLDGGDGLKGKRMRIYRGFAGMAWADYELFQTQIVDTVLNANGVNTVKCVDVQRSQRKNIFDLRSTNLTSSVGVTDTLIPVGDYSAFQRLKHGPSYSDAPSSTVGYIKVDDEVIRYSGVVDDVTLGPSFVVDTGNARGRGALGTAPAEHNIDAGAGADRRTEVEEFVYLELPLVKIAYAILTGTLYGDTASLPDNWHLNISTDWVATSEFILIGPDWWDTTDDTAGRIGRFTGLDSEDGKKFLEKEIYQLLGAYSPVLADGQLGLRRMTRVLFDASACCDLVPDEIISHTSLNHEMRAVANQLKIAWNWDHIKEEFTRANLLIDADSISTHGASAVTELAFRGLHGSRHTLNTLYEHFSTLRDRYAGPPQRIKVTILGRNHRIEVGDIVRLNHPHIQDYVTGTAIARSFEVQNVSIDWASGRVTLDLFGSSQPAGLTPLSAANVMQDSYYTGAGVNLETLPGVTNISGVIHVASNLDLTGTVGNLHATNAAAIVYANGPLVIDSNITLTCNLSTQLRVKGHLQVDGLITTQGNGHAGATSSVPTTGCSIFAHDCWYTFNYPADPGVPTIGTTASQGGLVIGDSHWVFRGTVHAGQVNSLPFYAIDNQAGTAITGLPDILIGTAGASGGHSAINGGSSSDTYIRGGNGGNSGGGLLIICRGFDVGAGGLVNVSGADGGQGTSVAEAASGAGAGGYPGGVVILLDGNATFPTGLSRVSALRGISPYLGRPVTWSGISDHPASLISSAYEESALAYFDASESMVRVQYIPEVETAEEDVPDVPQAPTAINVVEQVNTPQTPAENLASLEISVTPPSDSTYSHSDIYYKLPTQDAWIYVGPADNETVAVVPMDGETYDLKAVPVNIFGNESEEFITDSVTVSDLSGGVNLGNGNYIAYNKTGYGDDASVGFWLGIDTLIAKFNIGDAINSLKWDGADLIITGIINALAGGDIAGWTINANTIVSPNARIILDSLNQRIQVENAAGTNWIRIDGNGILANDSVLGTTVSIPTDGTAPTFSSGIIQEMIYQIYTSGVIKTAADPATTGGVLINSTGIHVYNSSGVRTAFLDAVSSNHVFAGDLAITDWATDVTGTGVPAANADVTGNTIQSSGGLLPNWYIDIVDGDSKPAGIYPVESITNRTGVYFGDANNNFLTIDHSTDAQIAYAFPAIPIDDKLKYTVTIRHKSGAVTASGLYLRFNELNTNLAQGKTHVGNANFDQTQARTSFIDLVTSGPMPGTTWVEVTYTYTPTAGTKYASFSMYNWVATTTSYSVDSVSVNPSVADVPKDAISAGITLTAGSIKRGTDEIAIDWNARQISVGDETYKGTAGGFQVRNDGLGKTELYAGDGANKYIEFDGDDLILGEDSVIRGAPSIGLSPAIFQQSFFEALSGFTQTFDTSTNGTLALDADRGVVFQIGIGSTGESFSRLSMIRYTFPLSLSKRRRIHCFLEKSSTTAVSTNRSFRIGCGVINNSASEIGFGFELTLTTNAAFIRGFCALSGTFTYTSSAGTYTDSNFELYADFDPGVGCDFYLNGVSIGTVTTNLPSGTWAGQPLWEAELYDSDGGSNVPLIRLALVTAWQEP